jgi:hypothetical protein
LAISLSAACDDGNGGAPANYSESPQTEAAPPREYGPPVQEQAPVPDEQNVHAFPAILVGTWNGGPGDSSALWLTFQSDGSYTWWGDEEPYSNFRQSGSAIVDGSTMLLVTSDGLRQNLQWQLNTGAGLEYLILEGSNGGHSSYVRG